MDPLVARIEFSFADESGPTEALPEPLDGADSWKDIPDAHLEEVPDALLRVGPDGLRMLLPAYMRWIVQHPDAAGGSLARATYAALTPTHEGQPSPVFASLDAEHSSCIAAFLERVAAEPGAHDARSYWRRRAGYLPPASDGEPESPTSPMGSPDPLEER